LEKPETMEDIRRYIPEQVRAVYSDPPWNPGNLRFWRTFNGQQVATDNYAHFLDSWVGVVAACQARGAVDVLMEQSIFQQHSMLLLQAIDRNPNFSLPFLEEWTTQYGSPKRPNALFHYGQHRLSTDPSGMTRDVMVKTVFSGLSPALKAGDWIVDPCMGLGTTSRVGHAFDCNVFGTELVPRRLAATVAWLQKKGYTITENAS
jgi:hypothetical protein